MNFESIRRHTFCHTVMTCFAQFIAFHSVSLLRVLLVFCYVSGYYSDSVEYNVEVVCHIAGLSVFSRFIAAYS